MLLRGGGGLASAIIAVTLVAGCKSSSNAPVDAATDAGTDSPADGTPAGPGGWKTVTAGLAHTCAIREDGSLWCWGDNRFGQSGLGTTLEVDEPMQLGSARWSSVTGGEWYTCGLQIDHSLWCWGSVFGGLPNQGTYDSSTVPVEVSAGWSAVALGYVQACGIHDDGTLWCWGQGYDGQGTGGAQVHSAPTQVGTDTWRAVAVGYDHVCAIGQDATLWCWGGNSFGQLGDGTQMISAQPEQIGTGTWLQIGAGNYFSCGRTTSNVIECWGDGGDGQLGNGTTSTTHTVNASPVAVEVQGQVVSDWIDLSVGYTYACGRRSDSSLWCWGDNTRDQLAHDGSGALPTATRITSGPSAWAMVAAGRGQTCAIANGSLWCVGADGYGQLGDGGTSHRTPTKVPGTWIAAATGDTTTCALDPAGAPSCAGFANGTSLTVQTRSFVAPAVTHTPWKAISAGYGQVCGIAGDKTLWCWGNEVPPTQWAPIPTQIGSGTWSAISAGDHNCAVDTASQTWCWGEDWFGETGNSEIGPFQPTLGQVGTGSSWSGVVVGYAHSCGMTSAGPECWGNNSFGQLGIGSKDGQTHASPAPLSGSPPLVSLAVGENHSCGLTTDGIAYCWGEGTKGQLGNGGTSNVTVATAINGMTWNKLAAGGYSTCGIATDGSLYCWGDNSRGQLGDGTLDQHVVPTRVGTDTDWVDVSVGYSHVCATKADHSLWCWGANDDGQLADGTGWRDQWVQVP